MANVIKTVYTYPLDGTTTDFAIPFEYLSRKFVVVTLIGQDRKELVVVTDYRFATRNLISTTKAWGPADNYQQIEIRRYTSASERLVDFSDGSILRATDLNVSQIQTLHVAEEARDLTADTIGVNNDGNLDGRGRRIVNVADGVDSGDVVTVGQMNRWSGSAADSANKAKTSETNAKTSETNSKASELAAKTSETNSQTHEDNAKAYAQASAGSATASANSATASAGSASAASDYASAAAGSATTATNQADRAKTEADKLAPFNTIVDRINSVAVSQVGDPEPHVSRIVAKPGTVYADGQLLSRAVYPTLWAKVDAGEVPVVDEAVWQSTPGKRGCYTKGTDSTNFRAPDYNGVSVGSVKAPVFRGDGGLTPGDIQRSGVPNVKGRITGSSDRSAPAWFNGRVTPPFEIINRGQNSYAPQDVSSGGGDAQLGFNLSLNSTVYQDGLTEARMNSLVVVWVIRTHGVVNNPGSVDAAVLASRVEQVYTELNTKINTEITPKINALTERPTVVAFSQLWGNAELFTEGCTITRTSTGIYNVKFTSPLANTRYSVSATAVTVYGWDFISIKDKTVNGFYVVKRNSAGTLADISTGDGVDIMVITKT